MIWLSYIITMAAVGFMLESEFLNEEWENKTVDIIMVIKDKHQQYLNATNEDDEQRQWRDDLGLFHNNHSQSHVDLNFGRLYKFDYHSFRTNAVCINKLNFKANP